MKLFLRFLLAQVNLADAGCIDILREILSTTDNETTQCKILLALNNLALNDYTIKKFSVNYFCSRSSVFLSD